MVVSEAQKHASTKYNRANSKQKLVRFYPLDYDLVEWCNVNDKPFATYIKRLIHEDMERSRGNQTGTKVWPRSSAGTFSMPRAPEIMSCRATRNRWRLLGAPCAIRGADIDYSLPAGHPMNFEVDEVVPASHKW